MPVSWPGNKTTINHITLQMLSSGNVCLVGTNKVHQEFMLKVSNLTVFQDHFINNLFYHNSNLIGICNYVLMWIDTAIGAKLCTWQLFHYSDVIMSTMASQITSLMIVYLTIYSGSDQRKHQSSVSLAFVWGIHQWLVNFSHKGPVMLKMVPFDDVIMSVMASAKIANWFSIVFELWMKFH